MKQCGRGAFHQYPAHLRECPWCMLECTGGPSLRYFLHAPQRPWAPWTWRAALTPQQIGIVFRAAARDLWASSLASLELWLWSQRRFHLHRWVIAAGIALALTAFVVWPRGAEETVAPAPVSEAPAPAPLNVATGPPLPQSPAPPQPRDIRLYSPDGRYACTVRALTNEAAEAIGCPRPRDAAPPPPPSVVMTLYRVPMGTNPQGQMEFCDRAARTMADAEAACGPKWQTYRRDFPDGSACTLQARTQQEANAARCQTFIPAQIAQSARRLGEWYPPAYPRREEERGRTACVTVQFDVSREGNTTNIRVLSDVSAAFADAAYDAVAAQRFEPARTTTGVAVAESGLQRTVKFELPDEPAPC